MNAVAKFVVAHSKSVLLAFVGLVALSSVWGFQSFGFLKGGGYEDPTSDSARVYELLETDFEEQPPESVMIVDFVDDADLPDNEALVADLVAEVEQVSGVQEVSSYYSVGKQPSLKSKDGRAVYVFIDLENDRKHAEIAKELSNEFLGDYRGAEVHLLGFAGVTSAINSQVEKDLTTAELIAIPLTLILLLFVFGSLIAAGLPLLVGGLAILGSFFFLWLAAQFNDTSIFALNIITGLGLGLGIDYSLLVVNRFREERAKGLAVPEATIATMTTAGRTVLFSGLTVAVVLASLSVFPQYFLQSFAIGGTVVVLLAILGANLALPAALNLLGDRINKWKVLPGNLAPKDRGVWERVARFVMRRPLPVLLVTVLGLSWMFSLSSGAVFGQVDDRILPKDNPVVVASDIVRDRFAGKEASPLQILVENRVSDAKLREVAENLSEHPQVERVQTSLGIFVDGELDASSAALFEGYVGDDYQRIVAIHDVEPRSPAAMGFTAEMREITGVENGFLVGGSAASYADSQLGIETNLPYALIWIFVVTFILLFFFTGSLILPIKAILLNLLSLGATLGVLTWIFMGGHLMWLIGEFTVLESIDTSSLVLIAVVAFGLSMDYELFLLSRIKEQYDAGLSNTESVAKGLQKSGRIITAAALVLAFNFAAFGTSGVTIIKMLGLGIAFAILLDATVVRGLLVPALMRLFGDLNWWAPAWMKRLQRRARLEH